MKQIDQRDKTALLIECNCGGTHYFKFSYYIDGDYIDYGVEWVERGNVRLIERIKRSLKYIINGTDIIYCGGGLTKEDLFKIKKHFDEYLSKIKSI